MKKKQSVSKKALLSIIIYTLFFSFIICVAGSLIFYRVTGKLYNDKGYVVANIILNDIDCDKIAEYTRTWEADEYYHEMEEYLHDIEEYSGAAYIYIAVPYQDGTMRYVYDSDTYIGDSDPIAASFEEIWKSYTEGIRPDSYLIRMSKKYGFLTSSCLPVKDSTGSTVALLFVDTHMNEILTTLLKFVLHMVGISLVLLVVFCLFNWHAMRKNFIEPVMKIKSNVGNFVQNNAQVDDSITTIKTGDEIEDLAMSVYDMEKDIVNYIDNLQTITAEKERISSELDVAKRIQLGILPRVFPPFPNRREFDIYATMDPAKEVGGDFYDFYLIDEDHLAMIMADVSGKGIPAALFMGLTKTLIKNRCIMGENLSTAEILYDVNNQICESNDADMFVTVWFCILQISTGRLTVTNAGHEHPVVKRAGDKYALEVYRHSPAVAVMSDIQFEEHEYQLEPGDCLFVYTDGVPEATNAEDKLFGTDRLIKSLNREPDANAAKLLANVKRDIDEFVGESPQFDDITMMCFKYMGK